MRAGLHLPNYPIHHWADRDRRVIEAARPAAITLMAREHDARAYHYLEELATAWPYKILYVVRFGDGPQTPDSAVVHLDRAIANVPPAVMAEGRAVFRFGNNTDKAEEWGDLGAYRHAFVELAKRRPNVRLVTTNLHDPSRWAEISACAEYAHGLGAELYGANGDPAQIQALIDTGKPVYVVETGTLLYREAQRATWIEWRFRQYAGLGFAVATWFIAGGKSYGSWDEGYILEESVAPALGRITAELMAPPSVIVLPKPAPAPIPPSDDPWLLTFAEFGGLQVRDVRAHFPEIGGEYPRRDPAEIDEFIVHHSTGSAPTSAQGSLTLLRSIDRYHRETKGWPAAAYGLGIDEHDVWWINDLVVAGYCHGADHNARGLGAVWLGDYTDREPPEAVLANTVAAWKAAESAVDHPLTLLGHQEAMPGQTVCPSKRWQAIKERLIQMKGGHSSTPQTTSPAFDYEQIRDELDAIYATANEVEADGKRRADALRAWVVSIKQKTGFPD